MGRVERRLPQRTSSERTGTRTVTVGDDGDGRISHLLDLGTEEDIGEHESRWRQGLESG